MLRFRWNRLRRRCGDGAAAIDETIIGAAPWRWRTGRLNRRDDEMDDGSSSGEVDEGRRVVAVEDVVGEEAPAGRRTEQGVGFRRGFSRPRCTNGWADGMGVGNHGLGTRLSEMWGKLQKYPHGFDLGGSFGSGMSQAFCVLVFHRRWEFSRAL